MPDTIADKLPAFESARHREFAAYHEAGHVVVAAAFAMVPDGATIGLEGPCRGRMTRMFGSSILEEELTFFAAGMAATWLRLYDLFPLTEFVYMEVDGGGSSDYAHCLAAWRERGSRKRSVRALMPSVRAAVLILRERAVQLDAVAAALITEGTLRATRVDALLSHSHLPGTPSSPSAPDGPPRRPSASTPPRTRRTP